MLLIDLAVAHLRRCIGYACLLRKCVGVLLCAYILFCRKIHILKPKSPMYGFVTFVVERHKSNFSSNFAFIFTDKLVKQLSSKVCKTITVYKYKGISIREFPYTYIVLYNYCRMAKRHICTVGLW